VNLAGPQPTERVVTEIRVGQETQEVAANAARSPPKHAALLRDILDPHRLAGQQALRQEILIAQLRGGRPTAHRTSRRPAE